MASLKITLSWLWLPMFWLTIARFDYALFILSTRQLDTAVSTTIFEIWPIVMVLVLAKVSTSSIRERRISIRKQVLMLLAFVGLAIVILSQNDFDINRMFESSSIIGIVLAAIGGAFAGISPAANIYYGDLMYSRYNSENQFRLSKLGLASDGSHDSGTRITEAVADNQELASTDDKEAAQIVWFSIAGLSTACIAMVPLNLFLVLVVPFNDGTESASGYAWLMVAIGLGAVVFGFCAIALRQANVDSLDLGVNSLYFMTPILSLLWLSIIGISLRRADLLWIGAILVFAMNGLIESNPDEEPDYEKMDSEKPWGTRLGFTSLILSLWLFGSFVYLRDEIAPEGWISWRTDEYWTLVSLSATVFALIFGFRVARLTGRLIEEDKQMITTFRRFERLVRSNILPPETLDEVRRFDTSRPDTISSSYHELRQRLRDGYLAAPADGREFFDLQDDLDVVAHSKQQGKDFSELMAIFMFAGTTIALGLLGRPEDLNIMTSGWSGFLTEIFTTVFVSVVVFLAFHLVDMRRDRQIPLIVPLSDGPDEYALFFRYKPGLMVANLISVLLIVLVVVVFGSLLYAKWL